MFLLNCPAWGLTQRRGAPAPCLVLPGASSLPLGPFTALRWPARTCALPALSSSSLLSNPQMRSKMFSSSTNKPLVSAPTAACPSLQGTSEQAKECSLQRPVLGRCTTGQQSKNHTLGSDSPSNLQHTLSNRVLLPYGSNPSLVKAATE